MMRAANGPGLEILPGTWAMAALPAAAQNDHKIAWVTDRPGGAGLMFCDGSAWRMPLRRVECFNGVTNGSGDFSGTFSPEYSVTPNVQPVTYPSADSITRVRVSAASTAGFTVRTERNSTVNVLGIDVLSLGTAAVASVPVRVLVTEST